MSYEYTHIHMKQPDTDDRYLLVTSTHSVIIHYMPDMGLVPEETHTRGCHVNKTDTGPSLLELRTSVLE